MGRWEVSGFIQGWGMQSESKILSFLFLILIKGTKRQDGFKIFCVAPEMERLSLDLPQAVRNLVCALEVGCGVVWNL